MVLFVNKQEKLNVLVINLNYLVESSIVII
jgi:hypothetical protein